MKRVHYKLFLFALVIAGCNQDTRRTTLGTAIQSTAGTQQVARALSNSDPDRRSRIKENLEYQLRDQIQGQPIVVGEIQKGIVDGLDGGSITIGQQNLQFLTTPDDTQLYLIAAGPFDASLTRTEIEEARVEAEYRATLQEKARSETLDNAIRDLPVRGSEDAPVTIVEFSDFQCPFCKKGFDIVEQVLEKYPTQVRFAYMHFPLNIHPWAMPAAVTAVCTADQDPEAFWTLHDAYFKNQDEITPENIFERSRGYLSGSGLDMDAWTECAEDTGSAAHQKAVTSVRASMGMGEQFGITGTPGFFINGSFIRGVPPIEMIEGIIDEALQDAQ